MSTATLSRKRRTRQLGPADHGRDLTYDEFLAWDYEEGHKYELIDGRLYVSPLGEFRHDWVRQHVLQVLTLYKHRRPSAVQRISANAGVFVPNRRKTTCPQPDIAVYHTCPPGPEVEWEDISPIVVVDIVCGDGAKGYVRNVKLYERVPSIREYWVFDRCTKMAGPSLTVYHRESGRQKWKTDDYGPEDVYSTKLLPGFKLPVCPPK
jgi:Uma2 family endonuclease